MKNEIVELITESYESGKITITEAQEYVNFVECADFNDTGDVDILTEMVEVLQESSVRPVTNDNRINYWTQMINATKNKLTQKMSEKSKERDSNRQNIIDQEISKLRANLENYQKNIEQIKENQTGQKSKGIGLKGTVHSARFVGASAEFEPEELSAVSVLENKVDDFLKNIKDKSKSTVSKDQDKPSRESQKIIKDVVRNMNILEKQFEKTTDPDKKAEIKTNIENELKRIKSVPFIDLVKYINTCGIDD